MFGQWYYKPVSALNFRVYKDDYLPPDSFRVCLCGKGAAPTHSSGKEKPHIPQICVPCRIHVALTRGMLPKSPKHVFHWSISYWLSLQIHIANIPSRYPFRSQSSINAINPRNRSKVFSRVIPAYPYHGGAPARS